AAAKGSGVYKPAASDTINLNSLQGMYYGFRADLNGYECGGICWDMYTFLPDSKVVVGLPENGGPETIDCKVDECQSYTIKNGKLTLKNGDSLPVEVEKGILYINEVQMSRVKT